MKPERRRSSDGFRLVGLAYVAWGLLCFHLDFMGGHQMLHSDYGGQMIRALILCGVVSAVGFGGGPAIRLDKQEGTLERLYEQRPDGEIHIYRAYIDQQEKRIKALEKRVDLLEAENKRLWVGAGGQVYMKPSINPNPFGSEPDSQRKSE